MRSSISYAAFAIALAAGATVAHAQTVYPREPVEAVITQPPERTVTTETVRSIRPVPRAVSRTAPRTAPRTVPRTALRAPRREVVTTRRTVTTTPAPVAAIAPVPQPVYDEAPFYDTVPPPPATVDEAVLDAQPPVATAIPQYRYVYEPDRILVVDPVTGLAVQALPR